MTPRFDAHFLNVDDGPLGQRFAIHHPPQGDAVRGLVVYVHPFAEEMNKSRRMAALQSRALAEAGFAVMQMDLLGCGDSAGDFGDATWVRWLADVAYACQWLRARYPSGVDAAPLWLWGLRAGCLLAAEAASQVSEPCHFLFWQPATSGKLLLQQFLRLKAVGELAGGHAKAAMEQLRKEILAGRSIDVAGYALHAQLCQGLEQSTLQPPSRAGRALWFETSTVDQPTLSLAASGSAATWLEAGWAIRADTVTGPAFWQTTEIEDAPTLLKATLSAMAAPQMVGAASRSVAVQTP